MALVQNNYNNLSLGDTFTEVLRKNRDLIVRVQSGRTDNIVMHSDNQIVKKKSQSRSKKKK